MTSTPRAVTLASADAVRDLDHFTQRAKRLELSGMRFQIRRDTLVTTVAVLSPGEAASSSPVPMVLGARTFRIVGSPDEVHALDGTDLVFSLSSITDRTARMLSTGSQVLSLPPMEDEVPWTAMTPPRTQWQLAAVVDDHELTTIAEAGIREIADALPDNPGQLIVNDVRGAVWGRPWGDPAVHTFPGGMAFAAHGLGFLTDTETTKVYRAGVWTRMTSRGGFTLCRQTPATGTSGFGAFTLPQSPDS